MSFKYPMSENTLRTLYFSNHFLANFEHILSNLGPFFYVSKRVNILKSTVHSFHRCAVLAAAEFSTCERPLQIFALARLKRRLLSEAEDAISTTTQQSQSRHSRDQILKKGSNDSKWPPMNSNIASNGTTIDPPSFRFSILYQRRSLWWM